MSIIRLEDVPKHSESDVGLKALNLSKVFLSEVRVPFTVIIPSYEIGELLSTKGIRHNIFRLARRIQESEDLRELEGEMKALRSEISSLKMSDGLISDIMEFITGKIEKVMISRPSPYAAGLADGDLKGRTSVWYDEPTKRGVSRSIQNVIQGIFSLRTLARLLDLGVYPEDLELAIMIQRAIFPRSSGVAIYCPARRKNEILIESSWGIFREDSPKDRFRVNVETMESIESELSEKKTRIVPSNQGVREEEVPHHIWMEPSLTKDEVRRVAEISHELSLIFGTPTVVEWIVQEGTNEIFVIQSYKEPERPPVKALEKKVLEFLRKDRKPIARPAVVETVERRIIETKPSELSRISLLTASKIYASLETPIRLNGIDGYLFPLKSLKEVERDREYLLMLQAVEETDLEKVSDLPVNCSLVVKAEEFEDIEGTTRFLSSKFPYTDLIVYLDSSRSVLLSERLSEVFDGAILGIRGLQEEDSSMIPTSIELVSKYFEWFIADLSGADISLDLIEYLVQKGADGFCFEIERLDYAINIVRRAEIRVILKSIRTLLDIGRFLLER